MKCLTKITRAWNSFIHGEWKICIALAAYLFPFYSLGLNRLFPWWDWGELYTFGMELKDFMTVWIALGGVIGVVIGIFQTQKRITQQQDQFNTQQTQFERQQALQQTQFDEQRTLQLKEQRDARFASGVELLGNPHESTRIGGAYNLYFLAREFPDDYLNPVCEILCAHLRSIAHKNKFQTEGFISVEERTKYPRNEVQTVIDLLFKERDEETIFEDVGQKNLSQIYLSKIDFQKAKCNHVNFSEGELIGVKFLAAKLTETYFDNAQLNNVEFKHATLDNTCFKSAELKNNNSGFMFAELSRVTFYKAELNKSSFRQVRLMQKVVFTEATLNNVDFEIATLNDVEFHHAKLLSKIIFYGAQLTDVRFQQAQLSNVDFKNSGLDKVDFGNATIEGFVNFEGTKLESHKLEDIVKPGRSLELTSKEQGQEENPDMSIS